MKLILIMATLFIFVGCAQKKSIKADVKYIIKKEYIYLPCKKETVKINTDKKKISKKENIIVKKVKKLTPKKRVVKKIKYTQPKQTKIYAPKKYIKMPNKKMDFMIGINKDGSEFVYLEGEFGVNTYKNFIKFIKSSSTTAKEIKINSNGGLVSTAMKIGSYVYENKWNTGVDKEMRCLSACGFVYFAGKEKSLEDKAIIGLHRPYIPGVQDTTASIRKTKKEYISYWNYIRASKSIYDEMMEVNRDNLFILDKNNINEYIDVNIY